MTLTLKPKHLKRYREIISLFYKYGHGDLVKEAPVVDDPLPHCPPARVPPSALELADDLERLGPTFVKLGQLISTRADFVPAPYMEALARLQDKVGPFSFDQVEAIVAVEIGARLSKAFQEFEATPIAAASLGQVHRAVLRSGQEVVVKVQRPGIRDAVADDLAAISEVAEFLDCHSEAGKRYEFSKMVDELRKALLRELDYRLEASNLRVMRESLKGFPHLLVPAPIDDYSTGRVLTMEYVEGKKITTLSPLVRLEIDGPMLAEELFHAYLHQILVVGVFHADPHPGNVFLTDDHRVALIDLGMVAHLGPQMQETLSKLLLAISDGQSDRAAEIAESMGRAKEGFDAPRFHREIADLVSQHKTATLDQIQVGRVLVEVTKIAGATGLSMPAELTMLGKTLLNLDLVGRALCPTFDPNDSIRRNAGKILRDRTLHSLTPSNLFSVFLEAKEFLERLPIRLNQLLDLLATNQMRINVDAIDEDRLMTGLQKIANRITVGLIIASLIVGAAMLMRVETKFQIFGYPGLAMICFLLASAGGVALVVQILRSDQRSK
jgi:ubiquinone biosynthesis protein